MLKRTLLLRSLKRKPKKLNNLYRPMKTQMIMKMKTQKTNQITNQMMNQTKNQKKKLLQMMRKMMKSKKVNLLRLNKKKMMKPHPMTKKMKWRLDPMVKKAKKMMKLNPMTKKMMKLMIKKMMMVSLTIRRMKNLLPFLKQIILPKRKEPQTKLRKHS